MFKNKINFSYKKIIFGFFTVLLIIGIGIFTLYIQTNEVEALSKYGSRGNEVTQIQTKLKRWGYYTGTVDGIYGNKTVEAVKYFQRKNGLTVDGVAGTQTLKAMGISSGSNSGSSSSNPSSNTSNVNLLARVIYGESRGEPYAGQVAVGAVIMNRVKSSSFPNTIARSCLSIWSI